MTMRTKQVKDSAEYIGKPISIVYKGCDGDNSVDAVIDVMETDGLIIHYFTEEDDSNSTCDEDDSGSVRTTTYIPWTSVHCIIYREDEKYP